MKKWFSFWGFSQKIVHFHAKHSCYFQKRKAQPREAQTCFRREHGMYFHEKAHHVFSREAQPCFPIGKKHNYASNGKRENHSFYFREQHNLATAGSTACASGKGKSHHVVLRGTPLCFHGKHIFAYARSITCASPKKGKAHPVLPKKK